AVRRVRAVGIRRDVADLVATRQPNGHQIPGMKIDAHLRTDADTELEYVAEDRNIVEEVEGQPNRRADPDTSPVAAKHAEAERVVEHDSIAIHVSERAVVAFDLLVTDIQPIIEQVVGRNVGIEA